MSPFSCNTCFLIFPDERLFSFVSFQIGDDDVKKRGFDSLVEASKELNTDDLFIITWDIEGEERYKKKVIKFIPLWKWLLKLV